MLVPRKIELEYAGQRKPEAVAALARRLAEFSAGGAARLAGLDRLVAGLDRRLRDFRPRHAQAE
jgi:hypothetical protein